MDNLYLNVAEEFEARVSFLREKGWKKCFFKNRYGIGWVTFDIAESKAFEMECNANTFDRSKVWN